MISTSSERTKRMSRYSVTVKIVHTWYEEIEVEASSEDGAEIIAELESVQATGEPVVDKYVYCNWMIKDTEPTPDEYDAIIALDEEPTSDSTNAIDIDAVLDRPKKSRRRSRKSRSKAKAVIDADQPQEIIVGELEIAKGETEAFEETPPVIEAVEAADIEPAAETTRKSRNRGRRSRSKARHAVEVEQTAAVIDSEPKEFFEDADNADAEIPEVDPYLAIGEEPAFELSEAPKKSRNRSRRSRSKARQASEIEQIQTEGESLPEIIIIEEPTNIIEAIETSEVKPSIEAPKKSRSRSRRSKSKPRPDAEVNQQQEVIEAAPEIIPETLVETIPVSETEPVIETPKKPRSRSRKPKPQSQPVSDVEQPQETMITSPEDSTPIAQAVVTPSIPDEPSAEKAAVPLKKPTTRKRKASKSSDAEQGPQIGDDSFLGSDE